MFTQPLPDIEYMHKIHISTNYGICFIPLLKVVNKSQLEMNLYTVGWD